jgi:hypothetical protein
VEGLSSLRAGPADEKHIDQLVATAALPWLGFKWHFELAFSIDRLAPQVLIEGRKARVYFTIMNLTPNSFTDLTVTATVRPQFFPHGVDNVTSYAALSDWSIPVLHPFELRQGVLTFVVPPASTREAGEPPPNTLVLSLDQFQQPSQEQLDEANAAGHELYGWTVSLATESLRFDSGARYRLAVTGIVIKSIASVINDTVAIAVSGSAPGAATPDQSEALGDHGPARGQIPVHLQGVGYFDSIADGNSDQFTMSYVVANAGGGSEEDLKTALDWISRIAAAVATAVTGVVYAPLWAALEGFTEWLNSFIGSCNRLVASAVDTFGSNELWALTYDQAQATETTALPPAEYVKKRGEQEMPICGTADYFIDRTIFRDRSAMEFIDLGDFDQNARDYPLVVHLKYGQTLALDGLLNLSPGNLAAGLGASHRLWTKEAGEGTINKGTFIAPTGPALGVGEFAVVTLQMLLNGAESGHGFLVIRFA